MFFKKVTLNQVKKSTSGYQVKKGTSGYQVKKKPKRVSSKKKALKKYVDDTKIGINKIILSMRKTYETREPPLS